MLRIREVLDFLADLPPETPVLLATEGTLTSRIGLRATIGLPAIEPQVDQVAVTSPHRWVEDERGYVVLVVGYDASGAAEVFPKG